MLLLLSKLFISKCASSVTMYLRRLAKGTFWFLGGDFSLFGVVVLAY